MKKLFTLLLLVVSFLAVGQTNNTSGEIEYWKSIADSNDTVAYRQYLNRYGETGLYYDEAITRILLLKTSGKQEQSKSVECCFYKNNGNYCVVRFDSNQGKVWLKPTEYDTIRYNLALSRDFYENQETTAKSRGSNNLMAQVTSSSICGKITDNNRLALAGATVVATHTPSGVQYGSVADANGNYRLLNIRPGGPYTIEYRMIGFKTVKQKGVTVTKGETKIQNVFMNRETSKVFIVADAVSSEDIKNAWTTDEEYEYDPMKSTSARNVYFKRDILKTMQGYRYLAFSKDKSSFIMWFEEENLDGQIFEKRNYYRVPKEDLLPKAVNYDFLNE